MGKISMGIGSVRCVDTQPLIGGIARIRSRERVEVSDLIGHYTMIPRL